MEKTLEQQIAELTAQVATLTSTNGDLTSQLATTQGELRTVRHKATFKEVALANGVKPKAVDSLYRLSGYDPGDADEANPADVAEAIKAAREEHDYCFEPAEVPAPAPAPPSPKTPPTPPAVGGGRGKPAPAAAGKFRVTAENTRDPKWLADNREAYAAAGKAGTLEFVED